MDKRSRSFHYLVKHPNDSILSQLQKTPCEYNIYGYEDNTIKGFILFKHTKTEKAVSKLLQTSAYKIHTDSFSAVSEIRKTRNIWETGKIPKRIKTKESSTDHLIEYLIHQNKTLIESIMEEKNKLHEENLKLHHDLIDATRSQHTTNNDYSVHKKITNINVFLNTDCKDAITLHDFVNQLVVGEEDIECMKTLGYVESVSQLLKRALKGYAIHKRPIHCTDVKREVIHVKNDDGWNREMAGEHPHLNKAFRKLTHIHRKKMSDIYRFVEVESKTFEEKARLMYEIAAACGTEEAKFNKEIIKNISENIRLSNI
jgi:hypothetical protein